MAEILGNVSRVSYILAVVFLAVSVFLWFRFRILEVIGDLSGRTAKKSIIKMRETNERKGAGFYRAKSNAGKEAVYGIKEEEKTGETDWDNSNTGLRNEYRETNVSAPTGLLSAETVEIANTDETTELDKIHVEDDGQDNGNVIEKTGFELIEELIIIHTDEVTV